MLQELTQIESQTNTISRHQSAIVPTTGTIARTPLAIARADDEIPNEDVLRGAGIDCGVEDARVILAATSRVFAWGDSSDRDAFHDAMTLIAPAIAASVPTDDDLLPSLLPPLAKTIPVGETALKRLGVTAPGVGQAWEQRPPYLVMAAFPLPTVLELAPSPAWPYVALLLRGGPFEARSRLAAALRQRAETLGANTLTVRITGAWILMKVFGQMLADFAESNERRRAEGREELRVPESLAKWTWIPEKPSKRSLVKMGAHTKKRDTSAVPVDLIRAELKRYARQAEWRRWAPSDWPVGKHWLALKRLAALALLATVSPRRGTAHMFNIDDFAWHRFENGEEAWGLRFRGEIMKMRNASDLYWKKLPHEIGEILHAWIICSGRQPGQTHAPLFISRKIVHPDDPGTRYADESAFGLFVSGWKATDRATGTRALVPYAQEEWKGYPAHRYRSSVTQHVESLIHAWKIENGGHPLSGVATADFAELLTDHGTGDMGYRDYGFMPRYEQIVALGAELLWNSLWGDGARRHGIDLERAQEVRDELDRLRMEAQTLERELAQHELRKDALRTRKTTLLKKAKRMTAQEKETARVEIDLLQDEIDTISDEIAMILRTEVKIAKEIEATNDAFRMVTTKQVPLPDDLLDNAYDRALAALFNNAPASPDTSPAPMADELLQADIAALFRVHENTIWRWRNGQHLPNPAPFDPTDWVMYTQKDRRLPVAAINVAAIPAEDPIAALNAVRQRRAALGFNRRRPRHVAG